MGSRKLLLLGWDAADWFVIHPLLDAGEMPNLQRLVEGGVMGSLATLQPAVSSVLWTSLATGKLPEDHRILGFHEPDPVSGGIRAASSSSRACKALWSILHQNGLHPHLVNWPASYPAEPIRGINATPPACAANLDAPVAAIHPPSALADLVPLRLNPRDLRGDDLALYIPDLNRIDQDRDSRPLTLARILSEGLTAHTFATWILENQQWDFLGVYLDVIARAGYRFMRYHPPRMDGVADTDFALFQHVIKGVYRTHDLMLGRLLQLAGDDVTVMIVSGHGFRSGNLRPQAESPDPVMWYREHGVFLLSGPGIRRDELVTGAGVLDIVPTVLTLFGIPPGEDMQGRVLREVFEEAPVLERVASWDSIEGDAAMNTAVASAPGEEWETLEALRELEALGYTDTISDDLRKQQTAAIAHQKFNLALGLVARRQFLEAIPLLEQLDAETPGTAPVGVLLAQACLQARQFDRCHAVASELLKQPATHAAGQIVLSTAAWVQGQADDALTHLRKAETTLPAGDAGARSQVGHGYLRLHLTGDAEAHFRRAIEIDSRNPGAWRGLACALLLQKRFKGSAEAALESVGLDYSNPTGHLVLGIALTFMGALDRARQAFESGLALDSRMIAAHRWLAHIHRRATGDSERAQYHDDRAAELEALLARAVAGAAPSGA